MTFPPFFRNPYKSAIRGDAILILPANAATTVNTLDPQIFVRYSERHQSAPQKSIFSIITLLEIHATISALSSGFYSGFVRKNPKRCLVVRDVESQHHPKMLRSLVLRVRSKRCLTVEHLGEFPRCNEIQSCLVCVK